MAKKRNQITRMDSFSSTYYNFRLKALKKSLGHQCTHLANRRGIDGERFVDVRLKTSEGIKKYEFSLPMNIEEITAADYERLEELIRSKM